MNKTPETATTAKAAVEVTKSRIMASPSVWKSVLRSALNNGSTVGTHRRWEKSIRGETNDYGNRDSS